MPRDTSAGSADPYRVTLRRQFARLDGGHPSTDPVPHDHVIGLDWQRTELTLAWTFAPDWNLELNLFHDEKSIDARYVLPDGTPFSNPAGDIHHRTETLRGMADARLSVNHWLRDVLLEGDSLHLGAGVTLPTGRIEEDPYVLGDAGLEHQHTQFGTGTVDPIARVDYLRKGDPLGFGVSFGAHAPLYENREDYRAPALLEFSAGPRLDFAGDLTVNLRYAALWQSGAAWDGNRDPSAGYFMQGVSLSTPVRLSGSVTFVPTVMRIFSIDTRGDEDTYEMDLMIAVSLHVGFGGGATEP